MNDVQPGDKHKQEIHLTLTNLRDAFRGQSRSPNIVPFHMLGIVSSCAIVTLSLRRLSDIRLQKCRDLENRVRVRQGHGKYHHSIERIRLPIHVL